MEKAAQQKGIIDPKIIIGGIVALVVIFFIATGSFKFSTSVKPNSNQPEQTTPPSQSKPKTYQNEAFGFSLEYPEKWSIKEKPTVSFFVGFFSPQESGSDDYRENLLIKSVDLSTQPNITLQEAADLWETQTAEVEGDNFKVTDKKSSTLAGESAKDIIFDIKDKEIDGQGMVRIILKNSKGYIFQFNALKTSFDKFLPDIETILTSVKF